MLENTSRTEAAACTKKYLIVASMARRRWHFEIRGMMARVLISGLVQAITTGYLRWWWLFLGAGLGLKLVLHVGSLVGEGVKQSFSGYGPSSFVSWLYKFACSYLYKSQLISSRLFLGVAWGRITCFCSLSAVLLEAWSWFGSGRFIVSGQCLGTGSVLGKQQRAGADSFLAALSALWAIKTIKNSHDSSPARGWKQALFVWQPDAGASDYISAQILVPVSVWLLTNAFLDVSQYVPQQRSVLTRPAAVLVRAGAVVLSLGVMGASGFPVARCSTYLIFCPY